jgi:hypothetical protein
MIIDDNIQDLQVWGIRYVEYNILEWSYNIRMNDLARNTNGLGLP